MPLSEGTRRRAWHWGDLAVQIDRVLNVYPNATINLVLDEIAELQRLLSKWEEAKSGFDEDTLPLANHRSDLRRQSRRVVAARHEGTLGLLMEELHKLHKARERHKRLERQQRDESLDRQRRQADSGEEA